jgi:chemotaxis family two-component system response regulator Rcp1
MSERHTRPIEILLVEDNPGDAELTRDALAGGKIANSLHVVADGEAALDFLTGRGSFAGAPRPDLVLLDLNLPKKDGREVLADIKADASLRRIPVVVLTSSRLETDVVASYNSHANCYITKPFDLAQFLGVVRSIEHFWLSVVVLPPSGGKHE